MLNKIISAIIIAIADVLRGGTGHKSKNRRCKTVKEFTIRRSLSEDLLTKVKKKIQKFKQHKNGAPKQATLHLKFQMVAVRRC